MNMAPGQRMHTLLIVATVIVLTMTTVLLIIFTLGLDPEILKLSVRSAASTRGRSSSMLGFGRFGFGGLWAFGLFSEGDRGAGLECVFFEGGQGFEGGLGFLALEV